MIEILHSRYLCFWNKQLWSKKLFKPSEFPRARMREGGWGIKRCQYVNGEMVKNFFLVRRNRAIHFYWRQESNDGVVIHTMKSMTLSVMASSELDHTEVKVSKSGFWINICDTLVYQHASMKQDDWLAVYLQDKTAGEQRWGRRNEWHCKCKF